MLYKIVKISRFLTNQITQAIIEGRLVKMTGTQILMKDKTGKPKGTENHKKIDFFKNSSMGNIVEKF